MAEIIPFNKPSPQVKKCSFCGHAQDSNHALLHSKVTEHCICNHCVGKARRRINEETEHETH